MPVRCANSSAAMSESEPTPALPILRGCGWALAQATSSVGFFAGIEELTASTYGATPMSPT